jgi:hypothetical protein
MEPMRFGCSLTFRSRRSEHPHPALIADEHSLSVAFYGERREPGWDGTTVRIITPDSEGEPVVVIAFSSPYAHFFGPPNDEAFSGHPLRGRGLRPYGAFEVQFSSWIRALKHMNSVHPCHRPDSFSSYRHFILSFHDSTFECIAQSYSVKLRIGSLRSVLPDILTATCDFYRNA